MTDLDEVRSETERWFTRHGIPHLIGVYGASRDVLNRAAPLLSLVFLAEIAGSLNLRFTWWQNLLAFLAAAGIATAAVVLVNRLRGRRPLQVPDRFGWPETIGFLVVPPALPLIFGEQVQQAALMLAGNAALLGLIYVSTSYALIPLLGWSLQLARRLVFDIAAVLGRTLPILLLFSVFMFLNAEMWKVAAEIPLAFYLMTLGLFALIGTGFTLLRLPGVVSELSSFGSWQEVRRECRDTPVLDVVPDDGGDVPDIPLDRPAGRNLRLVGLVSVGLQALFVSALVTGFYVLFGLLTIGRATFEQWVGAAPTVLGPTVSFAGGELFLPRELLVTAGFIGVVAGLQFVVTALTDAAFRAEFLDEAQSDLRRAFAVRAVYFSRLRELPAPADAPGSAG